MQKCLWASKVFAQRLFLRSQTRKVLSSLADIRNLPPGWNTTPLTQLSCATRTNRAIPAPTSHILQQTFSSYSNYALKKIKLPPYSFVSRAGRQKGTHVGTFFVVSTSGFVDCIGRCVRGPCDTLDHVIVSSQFVTALLRRYAPDSDRLIIGTAG